MDGKFGKAPAEDDTTILLETEVKLGIYDVLYQKWRWDGIAAESIIFDEKDIQDLGEEEIVNEMKDSAPVKDGSITCPGLGSGYVFVNFNFTNR